MKNKNLKILAIIPGRGGSKGISSKNIRNIGNIPLIAHTILSAKNSKNVNRIIVSTDSKKIATVSKKFGAEIPFLRPKKFALDRSSTLDVVQHTLGFLQKEENYTPDIITIMLPTSPFRPFNLIDKSIELLKKSNATSVVSVFKSKDHAFKAFIPKDGFLKPFRKDYRKYYSLLERCGSSVPLCLEKTPYSYIHVLAIEAMLDTNTEAQDRKNSGMKKI